MQVLLFRVSVACMWICVSFVNEVVEEKLSTLDSLSRLGHYVSVLDCDCTAVVKDATNLRNDIDETLEVLTVDKCVVKIYVK